MNIWPLIWEFGSPFPNHWDYDSVFQWTKNLAKWFVLRVCIIFLYFIKYSFNFFFFLFNYEFSHFFKIENKLHIFLLQILEIDLSSNFPKKNSWHSASVWQSLVQSASDATLVMCFIESFECSAHPPSKTHVATQSVAGVLKDFC